MGRWFAKRLGRGLVPGGRGFFNRPRGTRWARGGRGGHGGGGGGAAKLLILPTTLLIKGLALVKKMARPQKQKHGSKVARHQHPKKPKKPKHIKRPRLTSHPVPGHGPQQGPTNSVAQIRVRPYFSGVYNVRTRRMNKTKLLP